MNAKLKKTALFILFLIAFAIDGFAISRTSSEALSIANAFCQKSQSSSKRASTGATTLTLAYTCTNGIATRSSSGNAYYYVFNIGDNNGFVIVSGDDRAKEILGYSNSGSFDINSLPANFTAWLGFYQKELNVLMSQPETTATSATTSLTDTRQTSYAASVAPLLGGIQWNQGSPYNNLCPVNTATSKNCVTGCVATAMAQVMKYHKWPVSGTGSNTYTSSTLKKKLTVDFSKTTYDWANMTETYSSSSTADQNLAVATLMYHAGVSVNMDYGESSSASTMDMAKALISYFGYDSNLQFYMRDFYSRSEWVDLLKKELNAQRPVFYGGVSTDGGHQFVCDGYDSNDLFHFNWGWGGSSDGYFELSALNPGSLGIGGGTSGGFNSDQDIVIGVQKPSATSTVAPYQLYIGYPLKASTSSVKRTDPCTISTAGVFNYGINTFSGSLGIALYNDNGFVQLIDYDDVSATETNNGYSLNYGKSIPLSVVNGSYKLYCVYKPSGQTSWQIMRGKIGTPYYLSVSVTSENVSYTSPDVLPKLTLNSLTVTGNLYQNKTGRISVSLTNTGGEYNSLLALQLKSTTNSATIQDVCKDPINIPAGETKTFDLGGDITLAAGQYYLTAMYDPANDRSSGTTSSSVGNSLTVNVLAEPTATPILGLSTKISFPDATKVSSSDAVLTAKIKNTGGYFNDNVIAFIFSPSGSGSVAYIGYQKIIVDTNEEQTVTFRGSLSLDPDSYIAAVFYWDESISDWTQFPTTKSYLQFNLVNDATGIEQTTLGKLNIYPNPTTDKLYLQSEELVKTISIIDLSGKRVLLMKPEMSGEITIPVNELSAGTYILQSVTENGTKVSKFIKK